MGVHWKVSTTFHPQTDGQTERGNQDIQQYLQIFVNEFETDWSEWLLVAEFNYNNMTYSATGKSPFQVTKTYNPWVLEMPSKEGLVHLET